MDIIHEPAVNRLARKALNIGMPAGWQVILIYEKMDK